MMSSNRRAEIERLIDESYDIESSLSVWQEQGTVTQDELRRGQERYQSWYARATPFISEVSRNEFKNMYEGGLFIQRIKSFLAKPLEVNQFYDPAQADSPFPKWTHLYSTTFLDSFHTQRTLLQAEIYAVAEAAPILAELAEAFARFPGFLQVLQKSKKSNVPAPNIEKEEDLQVLVGACLRLMYDDVRPEDYVPEHAGGRSRVDFLLPAVGIVVETKMTRETLTDKKLGEELLIDWGRYTRHPDCRGIFALVYDPDKRLINPAGLQSDLTQDQNNPATRVLVVR
ncbi:hypothetical protein AB0K47_01045 [Streptomyces tirandamycinicus]|uniref:PD-(D/E)XK nuclease domain-containing protein n=1 Tax=Streptomyces tirandamycinicus TaxID=2174846 RepID=UPI0034365492